MTETERVMQKAEEVFELVSGQFKKWDNRVESFISSLTNWKKEQTVSFSVNDFYWGVTPNVVFPSILKPVVVESNRGDGYDPKTGIFTAPSDGSYFFIAEVFVSTLTGENADGSKPDFKNQKKWHDDMIFLLKRWDADKTPNANRTDGDEFGRAWIGEDGGLIDGDKRKKWFRKSATAQGIHYLKKGEKVALTFEVWNEAEAGDKVMVCFNFSGTKLH